MSSTNPEPRHPDCENRSLSSIGALSTLKTLHTIIFYGRCFYGYVFMRMVNVLLHQVRQLEENMRNVRKRNFTLEEELGRTKRNLGDRTAEYRAAEAAMAQ